MDYIITDNIGMTIDIIFTNRNIDSLIDMVFTINESMDDIYK
jgi:hypothetical protein